MFSKKIFMSIYEFLLLISVMLKNYVKLQKVFILETKQK